MTPIGEIVSRSPIEVQFASLLTTAGWSSEPEDSRIIWRKGEFYGSSQVPMTIEARSIRADFVFAWNESNQVVLVVELDGHEFHERTKDQALGDRTKDRQVQLRGHMMLRFTGREIVSYGDRCMHDLMRGLEIIKKRSRLESAK
jgi:very-short-patch-repair endonuclease